MWSVEGKKHLLESIDEHERAFMKEVNVADAESTRY
jgi:hypothetical protein